MSCVNVTVSPFTVPWIVPSTVTLPAQSNSVIVPDTAEVACVNAHRTEPASEAVPVHVPSRGPIEVGAVGAQQPI
jgi:hypothetical protein